MITLLQDFYILVFNRIFKYTSKIDERIRNAIVVLSIFWLVLSVFILPILTVQGVKLHTKDLTVIGDYALILICIFSIEKPLERVVWNKWITYPYFMVAAYMVLMSIDHYVGRCYGAYAVALLLIFPAMYFVWGNRKDYQVYYQWLSLSIAGLGILIVIVHFLLAPVNIHTTLADRYVGLSDNPNRLGMVSVVITAAALYLAAGKRKCSWVWMSLVGACIGMTWLTVSRTALIVVALQLVGWILIQARNELLKKKIKFFLVICLSAVTLIASFYCTEKLLQNGTVSIANLGVMNMAEETTAGTKDDAASSDKVEETKVATDVQDSTEERFSTQGKTVNEFSAGRIEIWKWYLDRMHVRGNDCSHHKVIMESGKTVHNAHNTVLEIGFRYGILSGIGYAIIMMIIAVMIFKATIIRPGRKYGLLVAMVTIAYYIEAMLDVMTLPFERGLVLIFYMSLLGIFDGDIFQKEGVDELE